MTHKPKLKIDTLIFAGHDVLFDVRPTYHEVVRKTVQTYLEQAVGLPPSSQALLTPDEVLLLQKKGQFTNYWDLTNAFLMYFTELLPPVPVPTFPSKFHVPGLMAYLQLAGGNLRISIDKLREQRNIAKLAEDIAGAGGGLDGAHKVLSDENRHMLVFDGEVTKTNVAARIFQELYLGAKQFEQIYSQPTFVVQSEGYAGQEPLVIDPDVLAQLSQKLPLGVVSDRPRSEVEQSLRVNNIDQYFKTIVTLEDIQEAKAKAVPDPWPLLEAARRLGSLGQSAYVGANAGDIQAAKAANQTMPFSAIGCLVGVPDKAALRTDLQKCGATMILGHPNNLKELILG